MKKLALFFTVFFALTFGTTWIWIQFPKLAEPDFLNAAKELVQNEHKTQQAAANDAAQNGYLEPSYLAWWGRSGLDNDPSSKLSEKVTDWTGSYSSLAKKKFVDHAKLKASEDSDYTSKWAQVEPLVPALLGAFQKPYFVVPEEKFSLANPLMNLSALRDSAHLLSSVAEREVAQGAPAEALPPIKAVLLVGHHLTTQGSLLPNSMGIAIRSLGVETVLLVFAPDSKLNWEQWAELSNSLFATLSPPDQITLMMKRELVFTSTAIENFATERKADGIEGFAGMAVLPGFLGREARIYQNLMTAMIKKVEAGDLSVLNRSNIKSSLSTALSGETGFVAALAIPSFEFVERNHRLTQRRQALVAAAAGVLSFKARLGYFPPSLELIKKDTGIVLPENLDWAAYGITYTAGEKPTLVLELAPQAPEAFDKRARLLGEATRGWYRYEKGTITLSLVK